MSQFKVQEVYVFSPQAKGKVERPYCRISLDRHSIKVPKVEVMEEVDLYMISELAKIVLEVRIWFRDKMVHSVHLPLNVFRLISCFSAA